MAEDGGGSDLYKKERRKKAKEAEEEKEEEKHQVEDIMNPKNIFTRGDSEYVNVSSRLYKGF